MSRFKQYMEIIQEMAGENKGVDDAMYKDFKKELLIYLKQKSLQISRLIGDKILKDFKEKKITATEMNKEETRIEKLKKIFNSDDFKEIIDIKEIKEIGEKLSFNEKTAQEYFVRFIKDTNTDWKKINQHIDSQATIDGLAQPQIRV